MRGQPAAPGVALGKCILLHEEKPVVNDRLLEPHEIEAEVQKFDLAVAEARKEIQELRVQVLKEVGESEARVFEAHLLFLDDQELIGATRNAIAAESREAGFLLRRRSEELVQRLSRIPDAYLRERATDIEDVSERVVRQLTKGQRRRTIEISEPSIVVAHNLNPSTLTQLRIRNVLGIATDLGGPTSHVAILARALHLPAASGLSSPTNAIHTGDFVTLDGNAGTLVLNPTEKERKAVGDRQEALHRFELELFSLRDLPSVTMDGRPVLLSANIELPVEAENAISVGAHGIGLYRTEFIFVGQDHIPSEEEQMGAYRFIVERMAPRPVTIRTLDAGGDKIVDALQGAHPDANPFMGWRSIRMCLDRPDIFMPQLRAILRASTHGNVRVLFPMIADIHELREAKDMLELARKELSANGIPFAEKIPVGAMVEVPSAALCVDTLAKECDFLSIGTNDLTQFTLAVDRGSQRLSGLYDPLHPAVLRLIQRTVECSRPHGTLVEVCGEIASDPVGALVLVGLGVDELSMAPWGILEVKKILRSVNWQDAREAALEALDLPGSREVRAALHERFKRKLSGLGMVSRALLKGTPRKH
jgi:phosphoenolpyruvate-protein phosphotransferase (PTS system enzyme I)